MSASKKKKVTKAEKLKMLQEEEERRLKEEEEARLKYEKEEMERFETERIEKEKWQQLEAKDLERRKEELEELHLLEACYPEAEKLKRENRLLSRWNHYIQCDGSPDPLVPQEMNTFISLWKEETNETFEEVIEKSKLVLNLIEKLKLILLETPPYDLQDKKVKQYQGSIQELQELLHFKFNVATELLLRQASTLADLDSGNMEKIIQHENITLYLWANLKKNPRYRSIRFSETKIGFEIPRILATCDIALRLLHTHYDHVTPLCPVPRPLKVEQHTSTIIESVKDQDKDIAEESISKEDQEESKQPESGSIVVHEEEVKVEEEGDAKVQMSAVAESETIKSEVEMKLLSETVSAGKHWRTDGISHVIYNSEDKLVTFNLETFGPVTLIQDAHINMPYQSWELRPLAVNKVLLTVTTVFTELQIQIKENLCMLASVKLKNKEHESILKGRWMPPIPFIIALKEVGLNIFPTGHSHFYVLINNKAPLVELKAYRQMALLSSAFAFSWSKWNISCGSSKVVFQVKEHLNQELDTEYPDWALLMFSGDRAQTLKISEYSETFSEALKEETEFHSTLYHMVKDFASGDAIEKIRSSNCQFVDCVCQMLLSTRLLSYS
ncbi:dynein axonemal intermediate chain 7 isoform 4-T4 [Trichechus inunguis]